MIRFRKIYKDRKSEVLAGIELSGAMFLAGSAIIAAKFMSELSTILCTEIGLIIAVVFMHLIPGNKSIPIDRRTRGAIILQALFGVCFYRIFTFWGLKFASASYSGLISSTSPALVTIFAAIFLHEKIGKNTWKGVMLVVCGLFAINLYSFQAGRIDGNRVAGFVLIFTAVICEAIFSILSKIQDTKMSAMMRTKKITLYACVMMLPFGALELFKGERITATPIVVMCLLYYGTFISVISYILWFRGIARIPANKASVYTGVVPVSSIILSALLLKETISIYHWIGLVCIASGIILTGFSENKASEQGSSPKEILLNKGQEVV